MKKLLLSLSLLIPGVFGANATVLFPFFVDIAPNYEDGNCTELVEAGVLSAMYHSTTPGFMTSTFTEVESFYKDVLPSDVKREEKKIGDKLLVTYSAANPTEVDTLYSTIYVLQQPDNKFKAVYQENRVDKE